MKYFKANKMKLCFGVLAVLLVGAIVAAVFVGYNYNNGPTGYVPMESTNGDVPEPTAPTEPAVTGPDGSGVVVPTEPSEPSGTEGTVVPTEPVPPVTEPGPTQPTEPKPTEHEHRYEEITKQPTCTEQGVTVYKCACGDSYEGDFVVPTGHSFGGWITVEEPTDEKSGLAERVCSECGEVETKVLDKTEHVHNYVKSITKQPTCYAKGIETYACSCGDSYTKELAMTQHYYTETVVQKADCIHKGIVNYVCRPCGDKYTKETDALGHKWSEWTVVKEPTATTNGEKVRTCFTCKQQERVVLEAGVHQHCYTSKVVKPTCTEDGYTLHICSCGESFRDTIVKSKGHQNVKTVVEPTCTEKGYNHYVCSVCGHERDLYLGVMPLGHAYSVWTVVKQPTATERGEQTRKCARCGLKNSEIIPALNEKRESFIDERIEVTHKSDGTERYQFGYYACTDMRTWGEDPSISIMDNGAMRIVYYKQDGTRVEYAMEIVEGYGLWVVILEDGSFTAELVADYSKG